MIPTDLLYTDEHEWVRPGEPGIVRVGITDYAASELGDVVFVSLPAVGDEVGAQDACAEVESTKSVSSVYAPVAGVVVAVNEALADAPETINSDPYGEGWLFEVRLAEPGQLDGLLHPEAYSELVSG